MSSSSGAVCGLPWFFISLFAMGCVCASSASGTMAPTKDDPSGETLTPFGVSGSAYSALGCACSWLQCIIAGIVAYLVCRGR